MRLIQLFITWILWIDNQHGIHTSQTSTSIETTDLEDGHPNHQLWRKMIDPSRPTGSDR